MRFISTLCAVALMTPVVGISQQIGTTVVYTVDAGSRVRIAAPVFGPKKQVGTVVSVTRDSLFMRQGASLTSRSVATSDITALEVSTGTYTRKAKGALLGVLIGAGAGAAIGYFSYKDPYPCTLGTSGCGFLDFGPGGAAAFSGALGGIVGVLIGTLIGSRPTDAWAPATAGAK